MKDLFASDYGVLERDFFSMGYLSNAAELLCSEELFRILHTCGIGREESEKFSDWELFAAFCRAFPMLRGHLVAARMATLITERSGTSLPVSEETAEALWHACADRFSREPVRAETLIAHGVPWLCDGEALPAGFPSSVPFVLDGDVLAARVGETLAQWHRRVRDTVERDHSAGCVGVLLRLPREYSFAEPNPYAIGGALSARRNSDASNLLLSQLVREICEACVACGTALTMECACDASVAALLRYASRTVGIPSLCVCAKEAGTRDALISLAEEMEIRLALRLSDTPTEAELSLALDSIAARYPIGRVRLITGADLRQSAVAQRQAERLLCHIS